jgi:hypothetical protein
MSWIAPIPSDFWTRPDIADLTAPALRLLGLTYQRVDKRSATAVVQLREMAEDLAVPYDTIRRAWHAVRAGVWFRQVDDLGRLGFRVWFADDWIEWHVMPAPQRSKMIVEAHAETPSPAPQRSKMIVEHTQAVPERHFNGISTAFQRSKMIVDDNTIIIDPWIHESSSSSSSTSRNQHDRGLPPPLPELPTAEPATTEPDSAEPILAEPDPAEPILAELLNRPLRPSERRDLAALAGTYGAEWLLLAAIQARDHQARAPMAYVRRTLIDARRADAPPGSPKRARASPDRRSDPPPDPPPDPTPVLSPAERAALAATLPNPFLARSR